MANRTDRPGLSLIELLVAVAVLAVLIGLLLGAVQAVRASAARASNMNAVRQVVMAAHTYAGNKQGRLPNLWGELPNQGKPLLRALSPLLGGTSDHGVDVAPAWVWFASDPSRTLPGQPLPTPPPGPVVVFRDECSLAFNPLLFAPGKRLDRAVPDGTANTIATTEHYARCGPTTFGWNLTVFIHKDLSNQVVPCADCPDHRASFADMPMFADVVPATAGDPPATVGSRPGAAFQVRPALADCDPSRPQSSLPGGILAGFADGSVRFLRHDLAPEVFWAAVTPDRGEAVTLD